MSAHQVNTLEERLVRHREISSNGCWIWTGYVKRPSVKTNYLPYGYIHIGSRKDNSSRCVQVSRAAASLWLGLNITDSSIHVLHRRDNPRCFNPDHLFLGDNAINVADRQAKGRHNCGRGVRSFHAKITPEQVVEIRKAAGSVSQRELGRRYGLDKSSIAAVIKRESWKSVA